MTRSKTRAIAAQAIKTEPNHQHNQSVSGQRETPKEEENNHKQEGPTHEVTTSPKTSFNGALKHYTFTPSPKASPSTTITKTSTSITTTRTTTTPIPPRQTPKRKASPSLPLPSPSPGPPKKKRRSPSKYAPPSKYAHLPPLLDILAPSLLLIFIGVNPGLRTSQAGHAYAHPSNLFWKLLHSSGITDRRLSPSEDGTLPERYSCGNTNIVERPTKDQSELSKEEMDASVEVLEEKIRRWRPEAVCIVGKGIWESVWRKRYGRGIRKEEFRFGWQDEAENMGKGGDDEEWKGAKVFVATSTSGLAASLRPHEKEAIWKPLGEWVMRRRRERARESKGGDTFSSGSPVVPVIKA
ncbi:MAG: hypothetical protein M1836_005392 [Candelina mexicana]|nr:MAG: hypothetical protein M1836_005392 [Candelina mexicana]